MAAEQPLAAGQKPGPEARAAASADADARADAGRELAAELELARAAKGQARRAQEEAEGIAEDLRRRRQGVLWTPRAVGRSGAERGCGERGIEGR